MTMPLIAEQDQGREHAGDFQPVAGLDDPVGEAGGEAAGAGHEFRDHRADQRQGAGNAQADEEIRQGGGQAEQEQGLPARRAVQPEQVEQFAAASRPGRRRCWRGSGRTRRWWRRPPAR